jgi:hypothetical protein
MGVGGWVEDDLRRLGLRRAWQHVGREHFLLFFGKESNWHDAAEGEKAIVGYICEWKAR